ncbi:hypothetical protein TL16_g04085, partial [Triparma laevis f. inornata]
MEGRGRGGGRGRGSGGRNPSSGRGIVNPGTQTSSSSSAQKPPQKSTNQSPKPGRGGDGQDGSSNSSGRGGRKNNRKGKEKEQSGGRGGGGRGSGGRGGGGRGGGGNGGGSSNNSGGNNTTTNNNSKHPPPKSSSKSSSIESARLAGLAVVSKKKNEEAARQKTLAREAAKKQADEVKRKEEEERMEVKRMEEEKERARKKMESQLEKAKLVESYISTIKSRIASRENNISENLLSSRKAHKLLITSKKLSSDLKKTSAFVKKVKTNLTLKDTSNFLKDCTTLNLTRYFDEIHSSLIECKIKPVDVPCLISIVEKLNSLYPDFLESLLTRYQQVLKGKDPYAKTLEAGELLKLKRFTFRVFCTLFLIGVHDDSKTILKNIITITGYDKETDNYVVEDAVGCVGFCRWGFPEFGGGRVRRGGREEVREVKGEEGLKEFEELLSSCTSFVDADVSSKIIKHLLNAYSTLQESLLQTSSKMAKMLKRAEKDKLLLGALPEDRAKNLEKAVKIRESLMKNVINFGEEMGMEEVQLEEDSEEEEEQSTGISIVYKDNSEKENSALPYVDRESKIFYTSVPNLLPTMPRELLGFSEDEFSKIVEDNDRKYGLQNNNPDSETIDDSLDDDDGLDYDPDKPVAEKVNSDPDPEESDVHNKLRMLLEGNPPLNPPQPRLPNSNPPPPPNVDLLNCSSPTLSDSLSERFLTSYSPKKKSRDRLTKKIIDLPSSSLHLLPFISRFLCGIDKIWKGICRDVLEDLFSRFKYYTRNNQNQKKNKSPRTIEYRLKNVRFICELIKFRVAPVGLIFKMFKMLFYDFSNFNVNIFCLILELVGRFVINLPFARKKMLAVLEDLKLAKKKIKDSNQISLIVYAIDSVLPKERIKKINRLKSKLEMYLSELILIRLKPENINFVCEKIRKLDWSDYEKQQEIERYLIDFFVQLTYKGRHTSVDDITSVFRNFNNKGALISLKIQFIDTLIEHIKSGTTSPNVRDQLRNLGIVRMLGSLADKNIVPAGTIFCVLNNLVDLGHEIPQALKDSSTTINTNSDDPDSLKPPSIPPSKYSTYDPRVPSKIDPPNNLNRLRMSISLMFSASSVLVKDKGNLRRLKKYLPRFQRYVFTKVNVGGDVSFGIMDLFDKLESEGGRESFKKGKKSKQKANPVKLERYESWGECHEVAEDWGDDDPSEEEEEEEEDEEGEGEEEASDDSDNGSEDDSSDLDSESDSDSDDSDSGDEETAQQAYMLKLEEEAFDQQVSDSEE